MSEFLQLIHIQERPGLFNKVLLVPVSAGSLFIFFCDMKIKFNWKISCRVLPVRTKSLSEWEKVLSLLV